MVERLRDEKLKDGSIQPENISEVELPEDEKSQTWRQAILYYSMAAPLVLASPFMYLIFSESMLKGEVCKFYELATGEDGAQQDCLDNYDTGKVKYTDGSGFRYTAFMLSLIAPTICLLAELSLNQLLISWKQLPLQYFFTFFYALVTLMWQKFTTDAVIFPGKLDWNSKDLWSECFLWFSVFAVV